MPQVSRAGLHAALVIFRTVLSYWVGTLLYLLQRAVMIWSACAVRNSLSALKKLPLFCPSCRRMDLGQHGLQCCRMSALGVCAGANLCVPVTAVCLRNVGLETLVSDATLLG